MHTLLYIKQVTNKGLLYSTWNSAQCYVAAWMGGKFGGEWILVYVWLHPFAVQMKLSQYCWFAIAQYNIKSSRKKKKNCPWRSCWREGHGERPQGDHTPAAGTFIFLQGTYVRVRRGGWSSPISPMTLWESEALCRFHSTLGQTRNHSPECKPPILQDIGNLEQETAVTDTLTSLSLTPRSLGWGTEKLQNMETVLPAQVCAKPHAPDDHRSGEGI